MSAFLEYLEVQISKISPLSAYRRLRLRGFDVCISLPKATGYVIGYVTDRPQISVLILSGFKLID